MSEVHVTVAAVVERDGRFLLVEERTDEGLRLNQPAGHLEPMERIIDGVVREALEETAYRFVPQEFLGIYRWRHPIKPLTYVRVALSGEVHGPDPGRALDAGIVRTLWLSIDEIRAQRERLRSPLVLRCAEDHIAGRRYPLHLICDIES